LAFAAFYKIAMKFGRFVGPSEKIIFVSRRRRRANYSGKRRLVVRTQSEYTIGVARFKNTRKFNGQP
jgi:hypothetical protein